MTADKGSGIRAWDVTYRNAGGARLWPPDPTIAKLDLPAWRARGIHTVLDAGCGDGKNLLHLVREGFFVVGADASTSALEKCRQYLGEHGLQGGALLLAPTVLDRLPLMDESVDAAVCVDVLGHLEEPLPVLSELCRVIHPGGALYASVFHVADGCRTGPRMLPGSGPGEFWYRASGRLDIKYYFRFYEEPEARALFESSGLRLESLVSYRWHEPPHVGYRDEPHEHESWFAVLRKAA